MRHQTFKLLCCLVDQAGETVSRRALALHLWGTADIDFDQRLNAAIGNLRKTMDDTGADPRFVVTVPREGYRFAARISEVPAPEAPQTAQRWGLPRQSVVAAGVLLAVVVGALLLTARHADEPAPVSESARIAYVEAQTLIDRGDAESLSRAESLLNDALSDSPQYSAAWAGLAKLWCHKPLPAADKMPQAKRAALTALEHDADNVPAQLRLAEIAISWDRDWSAAQEFLLRARDIEPGNASVHHAVASLRYLQGRQGEAEAAMLMGLAIDPLSIVLNTDLAWYYTVSGKYEKAIEVCDLLARMQQPPGAASPCKLQPLLLAGRVDEAADVARATLENATGFAPGPRLGADTVLTLFWRHMLDQLVRASAIRYVDPVHFARAHAQLGDPGSALDALALAVEQRSQLAPFIPLFPEFRSLHDNRMFVALLDTVTPATK